MKIWSDDMYFLLTINNVGLVILIVMAIIFLCAMIYLILITAKKSSSKMEIDVRTEESKQEEPVIKNYKEENQEFLKQIVQNEKKPEENYKKQIEEEKSDIKAVLEQMEKDLEKENDTNDIETFEREQEEKAIISYQELLKATGKLKEIVKEKPMKEDTQKIMDTIKEEEEIVKKPKEPKKFHNTEFISPVYGKESPESVNARKNEEFLNSLKDFRNNLE